MWPVLDIAISLVVVFLIFSIVVSGINEWAAQVFARRGEYLRVGLQRMLDDRAIYLRVVHHPLVDPLYRELAAKRRPPSYIDSNTFAMAIADVLLTRGRVLDASGRGRQGPLSIQALRAALQSPGLASSPVALSLGPIVDRAGNDLGLALQGIQTWFNVGMDRVSGWYKARTWWMMFWIGLLLATLCNIDPFEITATLNRSALLRGTLVSTATGIVETGRVGNVTIADLRDRAPTETEWQSLRPVLEGLRSEARTLPIGHACLGTAVSVKGSSPGIMACISQAMDAIVESPAAVLLKLLGWLLTAAAGTLGAGYWFDVLAKATNLRGAVPKPEVKLSTSKPDAG